MSHTILSLCCLFCLCLCRESTAELLPLKIGWIGPLSGPSAVVGVDTVPMITAVFDKANAEGGIRGRRLELVVEDDQYNVTKAVSAYKKLVFKDKVQFIFASTYGSVFVTARDALRDNVLIFDTLDCNDEIAALPKNTLCLATQTESIADGFSSDILRRGYRKVLLLVEESDGWIQLIARRTAESLREGGVAVLQNDSLPSESDYSSGLLQAKAAGVEAMVFLGNDQMGRAPRQARELGMTAQFYGVGSVLSPGFQALAKMTLEGTRVSSWKAPRGSGYEEFAAAANAQLGRLPYLELAVIPAYDAAHILVNCLREVSAMQERLDIEVLRECFLATHDYSGLSGSISFDRDGAVRSIREALFEVRGGELTPLS